MKVINCQTLGDMCEYMLDGEPVFLIRAQDKVSVKAIEAYLQMSFEARGKNTARTRDVSRRFIEWQEANPNRVKVPD